MDRDFGPASLSKLHLVVSPICLLRRHLLMHEDEADIIKSHMRMQSLTVSDVYVPYGSYGEC
jgi:hypothetical protein